MYKISIIMLSVLVYNSVQAQQTPVFAEYNYNTFIINSAHAGFNGQTEINLTNSGFLNSFEGNPKNLTLSFDAPLNDGKMGIGAGYSQDEIGVTKATSLFAAYSYKIFFDFKSKSRPYWQHYTPTVLSFGLTGGALLYRDNLLNLGIVDDPRFQENINATIPTMGVGFMFNYDTFYLGVSAPNILGDRYASVDNLNLTSPVYGYFGYRFYTNFFKHTLIKPNILLKQEQGAPLQLDFNVSVSINNIFEIGTGYRTNSSINFLAGVYIIKNIRAIYNYNAANRDNPINNTHGLALTFRLGDGFDVK